MSTVRLSDRQRAALLALAGRDVPITGIVLAGQMLANGQETSAAAAHQAALGLASKGLATKQYAKGAPVRYEITGAGRKVAAHIRSTS